MLTPFDWLRSCRNGEELLAALKLLERSYGQFEVDSKLGAPLTALDGPCVRCKLYERLPRRNAPGRGAFCRICNAIRYYAARYHETAQRAIIVWGFVPGLSQRFKSHAWLSGQGVYTCYIHGEEHFLLMMRRDFLKSWLQELVFHHGASLEAIFQILPAAKRKMRVSLGGLLNWLIKNEKALPPYGWNIQFYRQSDFAINPKPGKEKALTPVAVSEFLSLLEMAEVFRHKLLPFEQEQLYQLLMLQNPKKEQFYWGRFLGNLNQEAKDMLSAWRMRQWPLQQVKLLYHLIPYAHYSNSR